MEPTINFDQSDFKRLIDQNVSPNFDHPNGVQNLNFKILFQLGNLMFSDKLDNVDQLLARPPIVKLIDKFIDGWVDGSTLFEKNADKSVDFRNRGNREFGRRNFTQAAYLYTMAIVYAPNVEENDEVSKDNVPEEMFLAFGNRSAVFLELGLHEACLEDIEHALATGYPRSKLSKLLLRKIECLIALNRLGAAKKVWEHFVETIGTEPKDDERVLKIRLQLMDINEDNDNQKQDNQISLPSTNSMFPVINYLKQTGRYKPTADLAPVSAKLEPRFSSAKGRYLVAKVNIEPGDILMVESPYTSVLDKEYEFHFCHHCCRRLENDLKSGQLCINGALVPCTDCTRVLYCSSVCRTESWRLYHQFECAIQPVLCQMADHMNSILALRMLLSTGFDVIQKMVTRIHEDESKLPVLVDHPDVESQYEQVYRLVHHWDKSFAFDDKFGLLDTAAILVQLTKKCGFVRTEEQAKLAGTILLRHLLQLRVTTHGIATWKRALMSLNFPFDFSRGIYPYTSSLLNHSCDPNTVSTWYHGTLMIQHAARRIPTGTEVTSTYGPTFTLEDRSERQKQLLDVYHFVCECQRCVLEARDGLDGRYFPIGCKKCGFPLTRESSSSPAFHCSSMSCKTGVKMSLSDVKRAYTRTESQLATVGQLLGLFAGGRCTLDQLAECEHQLSELSKEMPHYYNLGMLYNGLADHYEHSPYPGTARKARQCFERFWQIKEAINGISPILYLHTVKLAKLYSEEITSSDIKSRDSSRGHRILFQRVMKRAIELLRLFSLADLQQNNEPDLMVDGARFLWEEHQQLVKPLNSLK